jgi:hypothetical protein
VGLDIGAETPEEIALAVAAEIQAVIRGRRGGFLSDRPGPVHRRVETDGVIAPSPRDTLSWETVITT